MLRFLFRMSLIALALGAGAYALGYRWDDAETFRRDGVGEVSAAARTVAGTVARERVREAGAELAEKIEAGAGRAEAALADARLTAKIKSKMALDDTLGDSQLSVDTEGTVVTVKGTVETPARRQRALQLARETSGVTSVVDRIAVRAP
jgi:osmotically-inducible protein OsmY